MIADRLHHSVDDLMEHVDLTEEKAAAASGAQEAAAAEIAAISSWVEEAHKVTDLRTEIAALTKDAEVAEIESAVLRPIAVRKPNHLMDDADIRAIARITGAGVRTLNAQLRELRRDVGLLREHRAAASAQVRAASEDDDTQDEVGGQHQHPVPTDLTQAKEIWMEWDWQTNPEATHARFNHLNNAEPTIFSRKDGSVVRIEECKGRNATILRAVPMNGKRWHAELGRKLAFKAVLADRETGVAPPRSLREDFEGAAERPISKPRERRPRAGVWAGLDATYKARLRPRSAVLPIPTSSRCMSRSREGNSRACRRGGLVARRSRTRSSILRRVRWRRQATR